MRVERTATIVALLLALAIPASAQTVTTLEGLSLRSTMTQLLQPIGAGAPVGDAVAFATGLEIATTPFATSSGGFVFKPDPATGLQVRTTSTFGPSFAERALTTGAGKTVVGANLTVATYDKLGSLNIGNMQLSSVGASSNQVARTGTANLSLTAQTLAITGMMGATENLDIGVAVPMVKVKLEGTSVVQRADGVVPTTATGAGIASGLGDVAMTVKYRFMRFGEGQPDPGGMAVMFVGRLPTGDKENFRGLGIYRALGSLIYSSGTGKLRPHANVGFEWWQKGLTVQSGLSAATTVNVRHQFQYAAGAEFEAAPKLTLLIDFLGRHVLGGGRIDMQSYPVTAGNAFGITSFEAATITDHGIQKLSLAPGVKWNAKGKMVFSVSARIPVKDNSLHDKFTPVVGLELTF